MIYWAKSPVKTKWSTVTNINMIFWLYFMSFRWLKIDFIIHATFPSFTQYEVQPTHHELCYNRDATDQIAR